MGLSEVTEKRRGSRSATTVEKALGPARQQTAGNVAEAPQLDVDQRHRQIAEAAYFIAEARGFGAGSMLDDWLAAEQQLDAGLPDASLPDQRS